MFIKATNKVPLYSPTSKKSTVPRCLPSAAVHAMGENSAGATSGRSGLSGRPTTASRSAAATSGSSRASAEERIDAELKIGRWQLRNENEALRSGVARVTAATAR